MPAYKIIKCAIYITIILNSITINNSAYCQDNFEFVSAALFNDGFGSMAKVDSYLYRGGVNSLEIFDISDPVNPRPVGYLLGSEYKKLALGNLQTEPILFAGKGNEIRALDISDRINPVLLGIFVRDSLNISFMQAIETIVYVGTNINDFAWPRAYVELVDFSDPGSPRQTDIASAGANIINMYADSNYVYTLYSYDLNPEGMKIFEVVENNNIRHISDLDLTGYMPVDLISINNYVLISTWGGILVVDITDPENPLIGDIYGNHEMMDIVLGNDRVFVNAHWDNDSRIQAYDINDPSNPVILGEYFNDRHGYSLLTDNDTVYCGGSSMDLGGNMAIVDFSTPTDPSYVGEYLIPGDVVALKLYQEYALIANREGGLKIYDVSNPYAPQFVTSSENGYSVGGIAVSDSFAYISAFDDGLIILDISDPAEPIELGSYDTTTVAKRVFVENNYAYLINYREGGYDFHIIIVDVRNPETPELKLIYDDLYNPSYINVVDGIAYISCQVSLEIVDFSDPEIPVHLSSHPYRLTGYNLYVTNNYVYVSEYPLGLGIYDVSDPENPWLAGDLNLGSGAWVVTVNNDLAIISTSPGLKLVDVSDPTDPFIIGEYADARGSDIVGWQDEYIYVPANDYFLILRLTETGFEEVGTIYPDRFSLAQSYPNPFNASTTIRYSLPRESVVKIDIYDILGGRVGTLVQGEQPAGYHQVTWDASEVSSGIYFYRIQAGGYAETRKMVMIK